jgi:hypothetical protein
MILLLSHMNAKKHKYELRPLSLYERTHIAIGKEGGHPWLKVTEPPKQRTLSEV